MKPLIYTVEGHGHIILKILVKSQIIPSVSVQLAALQQKQPFLTRRDIINQTLRISICNALRTRITNLQFSSVTQIRTTDGSPFPGWVVVLYVCSMWCSCPWTTPDWYDVSVTSAYVNCSANEVGHALFLIGRPARAEPMKIYLVLIRLLRSLEIKVLHRKS